VSLVVIEGVPLLVVSVVGIMGATGVRVTGILIRDTSFKGTNGKWYAWDEDGCRKGAACQHKAEGEVIDVYSAVCERFVKERRMSTSASTRETYRRELPPSPLIVLFAPISQYKQRCCSVLPMSTIGIK
jgi:hypothetical protein